MTPADLSTDVRFRTQTVSTTFADADILALANKHIEGLAHRIVEVDEDILGMVATQDLSESDTTREYALPSGLIKIKFVEAKLDGSNWIRLNEMDLNQYQYTTDEDTIQSNFGNSQGSAYFDIFRNSLWIYSGEIESTVSDGLKLYYIGYPSKITDLTSTTDMSVDPTTTTHGIPKEFHHILSRLISRDFKSSGDRTMQLAEDERQMVLEHDIEQAIILAGSKNLDRVYQATTPSNFDNGFDL